MRNLKLLLIFFLILLLNSCGYRSLNSEKINSFRINRLEIDGERKLSYKLKNNIEIYSDVNSNFIYDIEIILVSTKEAKIKNTAGKTTRYSTKSQANTLITDKNKKKIHKKTFSSINDYDIGLTHADTLLNEKKATENNFNYISNEIINYLKLLNM